MPAPGALKNRPATVRGDCVLARGAGFRRAAVSYAVDAADLRRLGVATSGSIVDFTWTGRFADIKDGYVVSYTPAGASAPLQAEISVDDANLAVGDAFPLLHNPLEPADVVSAEAGPDDSLALLTAVLAMVAIVGAVSAAAGRLPRLWGDALIRENESPPASNTKPGSASRATGPNSA